MKNCPNCQRSYPNEFNVCPQDGTPLVELGSWAEGTVVRGKYRILSTIGQGGMGVVYKALHVAFDELRALKVMHPSLMSDESFVKRFRHEAVITRRLQHPNAVRVDDIDEAEDGRPFIVMEYIEGRSLKAIIYEEGAMAIPRVCSISKQVAAALEAAHELGMIHRDIKPENIVLLGMAPHEQTKVLDFGIAKIKEARMKEGSGMTLTGAGVVVGTPQYMSPEQAMGRRGDQLDGRSDLYSLGVVMYQMLSGELPFRAETTMEMLIAHMQKPPIPLNQAHPELKIPEPMSKLVMRLLEKSPDARPASARALIEELEHVQEAPAPLNVTRIAAPEKVYSPPERAYSPEAAARALKESLESGVRPVRRHPTPPPLAPPRPAPPPAEQAVPRPAPVPAPVARPAVAAQPKSHGWILWASLALLVVALGGGFWFVSSQRNAGLPSEQNAPSQSPAQTGSGPSTSAGESSGAQVQPNRTQPNVNPSAKSPQQKPAASEPARTAAPSPREKSAAPPPAAKTVARQRPAEKKAAPPRQKAAPSAPPVDVHAVKAAIAMGDLYYDRGDYDSAIASYQDGLRADPTNSTLKDKIQAAQKAKAAEQRLLH
jgi:serine/threonine protein kinase